MAWLRAGLILLILPALVCANGFPHFAISCEQLLALLNSPDPQQRLSAATSLGIRREVAAVGALLEVVERPDELEAVKVEAIEAIGMLRDTGVMPRLLDHLSREPGPRVRGQIVDVLGELGGEQAWSVLCTLLQTDPSPVVRGQAAVALGRLRDSGARAVLEERLRDEPETHTRLAFLQGLGLLGDPAALPTVLHLFSTTTEPLLRQGAARTMGLLGDHRATTPLVAALYEPSVPPDLRQAIAIALEQLRDPSAIPALAGLLDDPDPMTVVLGIRGLGRLNAARRQRHCSLTRTRAWWCQYHASRQIFGLKLVSGATIRRRRLGRFGLGDVVSWGVQVRPVMFTEDDAIKRKVSITGGKVGRPISTAWELNDAIGAIAQRF